MQLISITMWILLTSIESSRNLSISTSSSWLSPTPGYPSRRTRSPRSNLSIIASGLGRKPHQIKNIYIFRPTLVLGAACTFELTQPWKINEHSPIVNRNPHKTKRPMEKWYPCAQWIREKYLKLHIRQSIQA